MPPATTAGSRPMAPPAEVCGVLCEVGSAPSKSHGSAATSAATSPSCSPSSAFAAFTERAPDALSANSTCSSAICCFAISAFSASAPPPSWRRSRPCPQAPRSGRPWPSAPPGIRPRRRPPGGLGALARAPARPCPLRLPNLRRLAIQITVHC